MYDAGKVLKGVRNPEMVAAVINRTFQSGLFGMIRPPVDVFERDWDNLLIMDACRYDMLNEHEFENAEFKYCWSGGSNSMEFLRHNVDGRRLDDVVWVTANPHVAKYSENIFEIINVWNGGWNEEFRTVLPEKIVEEAKRAEEQYPNKRLVVHFMQPHYPFIGPIGREELPEHRSFTGDGRIRDGDDAGKDVWEHLQEGTVSEALVWDAYRENLETVLPHAKNLIKKIRGKSVLTSDHGNELGRRSFPIPIRLYGHPGRRRTKNLVKVPWVVFDKTHRKEIRSGDGINRQSVDERRVEERLTHLGYK